MAQTLEPHGLGTPAPALPPQLAAIMRPELPGLADEIIAEIRRTIPEYASPMSGPYGHALRVAVEEALRGFVDQVADPTAPHEQRDGVYRKLGRNEAREGRSLDSLQAAYRVGARVAWHRVMKVGQRHNLSSSIMSLLADDLFAYMDELVSLSLEGYTHAKERSAQAQEEWCRRLLQLILERPAVPPDAIAELARRAGWSVPAEVALVAVSPGTQCARALVDDDVLVDVDAAQPHLLVPGPLHAARRAMVEAALPQGRVAVGPTVPLADAADSLRWARQALDLAESGVIDGGRVVLCEEHLCTLWLLSDGALVDQIARRQFAALADLTPRQRGRLTETLAAWLEARGSAAKIADRLHIHPQTVRYRMRQVERALGDQLDDPDQRFAMELVLRAQRLRRRASRRGQAGLAARSRAS
jgi:DNA-binding CsgD family transcriptional regulator